MKKLIIISIAVLCFSSVTAQFKKDGYNYTVPSAASSRAAKDSIATLFTLNGEPIYVRKTDGYCWVCKYAKTTGRFRRVAVPEDVAKDICKQIGIKYTYVKRSRKK